MRLRRSVVLLLVLSLVAAACDDFDDVFDDEAFDDEAFDDDNADLAGGSDGEVADLGAFSFDWVQCPMDVEVEIDVDCGVLTVPESRTGLSDDTIDLAVAVLRTPAADPQDDPVVFLQGGPGGVSLAEHWSWQAEDWPDHPLLAKRDLILVDQRGTGYSVPTLACDDEREEPEDCHDRLVGEGIPIAAYSTPENAADLAALRLGLELDEWNLFGASYGTRLGLVLLRDHPEGVRSVVLDGVYPPNAVPAYESYVVNALGAIDAIAAACAAQPACTDAYGDVEVLLAEALATVADDPDAPIDHIDLFDLMFEAMYDMDRVVDIPYALLAAVEGDIDVAIDVLEGEVGGLRPVTRAPARRLDPEADSSGAFHAIECREEHPFTDLDRVEVAVDELSAEGVDALLLEALFSGVVQGPEFICPAWEVGVADAREQQPAVSDVPTLLLSGVFDPITPASLAQLAARDLSNATVAVAANLSHSTVLEDDCIDGVVAAFLDDPGIAPDVSCVAGLTAPSLTLP